jgi:hypothetical protein
MRRGQEPARSANGLPKGSAGNALPLIEYAPCAGTPRTQTCTALVAISLALAAALGAPRTAEGAATLPVQSVGTCPNADQVSAALDYLLKESGNATGTDAVPPAPTLVVVDLGSRYQVSLAGQTRAYEDPARDCAERARVAAVFAAVTMEPPEVAARAKPLAPPEPRSRYLELLAGGRSEVGIERAHQTFTGGAELRATLTGQRWGAELGAGAEWPATLAWGSYRAQITRFPLDISARVVLRRKSAVASLSVGVVVALFNLRGEGAALPVHDGGTRADVGLRAALSVTLLPSARFSPYLSLHTSVSPNPYAVIVDPVGQIGATPQVWVGATLGIAAAVR